MKKNNMIDVEKLCFSYSGKGKNAVKDMSFSVSEGEIFGFLGPSGAGKTTTQRLLIGLLRNYSGRITVMGKERSAWGNDFYEQTGVAFDFPNLYLKLTAVENLRLIGSYYRNKPNTINQWLDRVGLLPHASERVEGYSKGMKMRLNFIRALMHDPRLLFFDEPTSGLDPVNAHVVKEIIKEQRALGKTVFLTTHNMTVAEQLCDRVAFIVDGEIILCGSPGELMVRYGKRRLMVETNGQGDHSSREYDLDYLGENSEFLDLLKEGNIRTMHSAEASLEDIFIKLTGKQLICD
ncbi:MAG: ABC transporter ATP-binding protein [Bacteroidales bacterium]|jgi:fluoroquinolone transport system ATP-binding protein